MPQPDGGPAEAGRRGKRKTLVVVLHGLNYLPERMKDVVKAVREAYGADDTEVRLPELPYAHWWSGARATRIVADLLSDIDRWVHETDPERIVFIGHSMGATIARRTFLVAAGCPSNFRPEPELACEKARPWADRVERVVMLAAFNRGWKITPRLSWRYAFLYNVIALVGHLVPGKVDWTPTFFDFRQGAPFIAQTRLHWLAYRRAQQSPEAIAAAAGKPDRPVLLQLIGTQDDLISPFDQVDIAVDSARRALAEKGDADAAPSPNEQDYFLVELPYTGHGQTIELYGDADADERRQRVLKALTGNRAELADLALDPTLLTDEIDPIDHTVEDTVFVIHGIRDDGYWTHRVAERVRQAGGREPGSGATVFRSWTPTYGYFAMLPFMLPWIRRQKVEWFMDQYVNAFAQYPHSDFHYVGHSNGTYLAARALEDYPALHFKHVLFAGSVVRRDYRWVRLIDSGRVARFQNICASGDWVVAWLPKSVEWLPFFDLGGAGFDGFRDAAKRPQITQFKYVHGGHGAGIMETHWEQIADFVVRGAPFTPTPPDPALYDTAPDPTIRAIAQARIGVPVAILIALAVAWFGFQLGGWFGLLVAVLIIRFIVTRV